MPHATRLVTADELERFPSDDRRYELVDGRLVRMSPVNLEHGVVVVRLASMLDRHVRAFNLGIVAAEVGFTLRSNPDTVRAPDVAFLRRDRIPSPRPRGFWKGQPDLAIEVLSPDDRPGEMQRKIEDYLTRGVAMVLIADPDTKTVTVHRLSTPAATLVGDEVLDLGEVVSGFRCGVQEIFE